MGKKKPFVDKKNSSTFHLLYRSQRDVSQHLLNEDGDTDDGPGYILWPAEGNNPKTNQAVLGTPTVQGGKSSSSGDGDGDGDGGVINNSNNNKNCDRMQLWREKLKQAGLLDEGDQAPERYLKEISGTGTFLAANGKIGNATTGIYGDAAVAAIVDVDMLEVKDQLDNIPLREALDEDIAAILYGDTEDIDFDELEELNDEFVLDAAKEYVEPAQPATPDGTTADAFDYDAHIQKLLDKARQERQIHTSPDDSNLHEWARRDQNFFAKSSALHEQVGEDDDDNDEEQNEEDDSFANINDALLWDSAMMTTAAPGAVAKLSPEEERALREKFEQTLLEYDSDDMGNNSDDEEIEGLLPLEGDEQVEAALNDFLQEREDEVFIQGRSYRPEGSDAGGGNGRRGGGSGFSVLVGTRMVQAKELDKDPEAAAAVAVANTCSEPIEQVLAQAKARLAEPILQLPPEEIIMDGQSYFSERIRNPWDCESILSTYSNLDNNPTIISLTTSRRRRKQQSRTQAVVEEELVEQRHQQQILLSNKTGLPLLQMSGPNKTKKDLLGDGDDDNNHELDTTVSVNKGQARPKKHQETPAEKQLRKAAVKRERQVARIQKKITRQVFGEEFAKHSMVIHPIGAGDPVAGKPVFRYS